MAKPCVAHLRLIAQADLRIGQRPALGDEDLRLDHVEAGDLLGDGVLDLDARIDLDEVELAAVDIDEELDGAGVVEPHGPADGQGGVEDAPGAAAGSRFRAGAISTTF